MSLSRWGERVEKAMNPPELEPLTPGEAVSLAAHNAEIEETARQINTWMTQRLGSFYRGAHISVKHEDLMAWYLVTITYEHDGPARSTKKRKPVKTWAVANIRNEEIEEHTKSTHAWSVFMDRKVRELRDRIQKQLLDAGVIDHPSHQPTLSLNAAADELRRIRSLIPPFDPDQVDPAEEAEAIESIKRSIAAQRPDEA